jgi:hypothetical protein
MSLRLVQKMRQVNQAIDQTGHAGLVHRNGHKFSGLKIENEV